MDIFLEKHRESILGVVEGFDRIIFKGYLTSMFPDGAFGRYLYKRGVPTTISNARTRTPAVNRKKRWPGLLPSKTGSPKAWCASSRFSNLVSHWPLQAIARRSAWKSSGVIAGACTCTGT